MNLKKISKLSVVTSALAIPAISFAAITLTYQGNSFDVGDNTLIPGPITGSITFDVIGFSENQILMKADIIDFNLAAEVNGQDQFWTFVGASWFEGEFLVNETATGFDSWGFWAEQELVGGNSNVESLLIDNNSSFRNRQRDAVTTGDDNPNQISTSTSEIAASVDAIGVFNNFPDPSPVPLPAAFWLFASALFSFFTLTRIFLG